MQIDFLGANCLRIKTNNTVLVFDDNLSALGRSAVATASSVVCITNASLIDPPQAAKIVFDTPGNYEVGDILIDGIRAEAFLEDQGGDNGQAAGFSTIYKVASEDINLAVTGHIKPTLTEAQLDELGSIDVLFVPVGGHGFTLDAQAASQVVKSIAPRLIVPTYFAQAGLKFEVVPASYEEFAKLVAPSETEVVEGGLKIKKKDLVSERLALKVLS